MCLLLSILSYANALVFRLNKIRNLWPERSLDNKILGAEREKVRRKPPAYNFSCGTIMIFYRNDDKWTFFNWQRNS